MLYQDIPTGIYLLDVLSINQVFSQLKIKVTAETESIGNVATVEVAASAVDMTITIRRKIRKSLVAMTVLKITVIKMEEDPIFTMGEEGV